MVWKWGVKQTISWRCVTAVFSKYSETTETSQGHIHELKNRLNSGNVCYCEVENALSFRLLCKNENIKEKYAIFLATFMFVRLDSSSLGKVVD
jgi:hypothetical protein